MLDCCRERVKPNEEVPHEVTKHLKNSKGEKVDEALYANEQAYEDEELFTITYGCKPSYGVLRGSWLGPKYIQHLKTFADEHN